MAARLVLLTSSLWSLFTHLMGLPPGHHREAVKSRRDFLLRAAQVVESGRQRIEFGTTGLHGTSCRTQRGETCQSATLSCGPPPSRLQAGGRRPARERGALAG
ncbi:MAG TPA: hypothetical protein VI136_09440, partial [Verrucomicrobiae bacterium]